MQLDIGYYVFQIKEADSKIKLYRFCKELLKLVNWSKKVIQDILLELLDDIAVFHVWEKISEFLFGVEKGVILVEPEKKPIHIKSGLINSGTWKQVGKDLWYLI
jgi:hypothetical protein